MPSLALDDPLIAVTATSDPVPLATSAPVPQLTASGKKPNTLQTEIRFRFMLSHTDGRNNGFGEKVLSIDFIKRIMN